MFWVIIIFFLLRSCVAGRSPAGSTAWPTSAPACRSFRAACPKSGWRPLPYSPAWARSSTLEAGSSRRRRTLLPQPPWPPCRPAHLRRPPTPPPLCLDIIAPNPAGRRHLVPLGYLGLEKDRLFPREPAATEEFSHSQKSWLTVESGSGAFFGLSGPNLCTGSEPSKSCSLQMKRTLDSGEKTQKNL